MSRLSIRPRPLDFNKKLPIVKSVKDFEDDIDTPTNTRNSQFLRLAAEAPDTEVQQVSAKKLAPEIPTPEFVIVDTYERDYSPTFTQPTSYIHARGARAEIGEFVEYDLDNEDEDWLHEFNKERKILPAENFSLSPCAQNQPMLGGTSGGVLPEAGAAGGREPAEFAFAETQICRSFAEQEKKGGGERVMRLSASNQAEKKKKKTGLIFKLRPTMRIEIEEKI